MEKLTGGQRPAGEERDNLFLGLFGLEGTGKTSIGLSLPPPIMYVNCDRPAGSLIAKLPPEVEIFYVPMQVDMDSLTVGAAQRLLLDFDAAVRTAIAQCKSFFLDGEDRFLDVVRLALLPENAVPRDHAKSNSYMDNHYSRLSHSGLQVCISTSASPVWTGAKTKTDYYDRKGFSGTRGWMNTELFVYCPEWTLPKESLQIEAGVGYVDAVNNPITRTHMSRFVTSKLKESLLGVAVQDATFDLIYRMVHGVAYEPDSD